jgi:hypothetical protein
MYNTKTKACQVEEADDRAFQFSGLRPFLMEDLEEMVGCEAFQVCGQAISFGHIRRATASSCPTFRKNWKALGG